MSLIDIANIDNSLSHFYLSNRCTVCLITASVYLVESYRILWRRYYPTAAGIHSRYVNESDRSKCVIIHVYRNARYTRSLREKDTGSQVGQLHIGTGGIYGDFIICEGTIISWTTGNGAKRVAWARERANAKEGCDCNSGCVFLVITRGARRVTFRHRIILAARVRERARVSKKEGRRTRGKRVGGIPAKIENPARTAMSRVGATGYVYFPREYSALPNERAAESVRR